MAGRMRPAQPSMPDAAWPSSVLFPTRATRHHVLDQAISRGIGCGALSSAGRETAASHAVVSAG